MATKHLDPIPPGEILREEFMKPLGVSINTLARDLDVPTNRISEIVNGKRAITADTALRLGKYFGVSPEIWLDLQSNYELRVARRDVWPKAEPRVRSRARPEHASRPQRSNQNGARTEKWESDEAFG